MSGPTYFKAELPAHEYLATASAFFGRPQKTQHLVMADSLFKPHTPIQTTVDQSLPLGYPRFP